MVANSNIVGEIKTISQLKSHFTLYKSITYTNYFTNYFKLDIFTPSLGGNTDE